MRKIESLDDQMRGTVTYEMPDGRFVRLDAFAVREYGAVALLREHGYEPPDGRVDVMQRGQRVGTVPVSFEPMNIKSASFFYDPRPGDFTRDGDVWIASHTLGPGDLEAVPGFERFQR